MRFQTAFGTCFTVLAAEDLINDKTNCLLNSTETSDVSCQCFFSKESKLCPNYTSRFFIASLSILFELWSMLEGFIAMN